MGWSLKGALKSTAASPWFNPIQTVATIKAVAASPSPAKVAAGILAKTPLNPAVAIRRALPPGVGAKLTHSVTVIADNIGKKKACILPASAGGAVAAGTVGMAGGPYVAAAAALGGAAIAGVAAYKKPCPANNPNGSEGSVIEVQPGAAQNLGVNAGPYSPLTATTTKAVHGRSFLEDMGIWFEQTFRLGRAA